MRLIYLFQPGQKGGAVQFNSRRCFSCLLVGGVSYVCVNVAPKYQSHPRMGFQVDLDHYH